MVQKQRTMSIQCWILVQTLEGVCAKRKRQREKRSIEKRFLNCICFIVHLFLLPSSDQRFLPFLFGIFVESVLCSDPGKKKKSKQQFLTQNINCFLRIFDNQVQLSPATEDYLQFLLSLYNPNWGRQYSVTQRHPSPAG